MDPALLEEAKRRGLIPEAAPSPRSFPAPPSESPAVRRPAGISRADPFLMEEARRRGLVPKRPSPFAPIPQPVKPELAPPKSVNPVQRSTFTGMGATFGGFAGAPAGPLGILGGSTAGATAGSLLYDLTERAAREITDTPQREEGPYEPLKRAGREAGLEAGFTGATMAAGPVLRRLGKPLLGRVFGVFNPESRRMTDLASAQGIDLGAAHVSARKSVRGAPRVFGVFPFVGTPLRKGQARVVGQLDERAADLLNTLAPATTRYDVGKRLTKAAVGRYNKFSKVAAGLYDRFNTLADGLSQPDIVPAQPLKDRLSDIARSEAAERITLETGEAMRRAGADPIGDFIAQIADLPERITVRQTRGLERQLNKLIREGGKQGWDVARLKGIKGGLNEAKNALDISVLPEGEGEAVLDAWRRANDFFSKTTKTFETSTARKFGRASKNIFNKGVFKPGTINTDEVYRAVYQANSPEALADLKNLVGPGEFRRAGRQFLGDMFEASRVRAPEGAIVEDMFSAAKFEKNLGLDRPEGWEALGEVLKASDVTVKDFRNFLEVAKTATDITIRDPSTFLTRRLILGGGLAGGALVAGGKMSIPPALLLTLAMRKSAAFLMDKKQLIMMTRLMSDTTGDHQRRALLVRFLRQPITEEKGPETAGP